MMVVDDEPWGRKSVSKMIGELALDVEVVAEARNGAEALELIPISRPQIVVTDMNMPVMNGQQFLETLYHRHNPIKVIVISGHSQFEYMKAAVTYQACEYVLKPVSLADLRSAMIKAMEASRNHLSIEQRQQFTSEMRKLRTEAFLQNVTGRRIANAADIEAQSAKLVASPVLSRYRLAVCMLRQFRELSETKFNGNADLLMYSVENILYEVIQDDVPYIYKSDDKMRLCLLLPESGYDGARVQQLLQPFHDAVSQMYQMAVVVGLSATRNRLDQLPEAFEEANELLRGNPMQGTDFSMNTADAPRVTATASEVLSGFEAKLLQQAMAAAQASSVRRMFGEFLRKAEAARGLTISDGQKELRKLVDLASSEWAGIVNARPAVFELRTIDGIIGVSAMRSYVEALTDAIEAHMESRAVPESANPMHEIAAYLDEHYFEDLSLIDVATRYHLDPSYLSKQFKAVTGENFIEYVTRKRMEKACELLRSSDRKINDISELVGYENQRYFSQVFKKFTGQTPSEYRETPANTPHAKN
ncbi:response regulator transcription factor [Cohnella yongneupensis]|uniref:Helix-turn-helix domain-containing protein n=1 Tax=Cohnella yongneupensis TaxID=425006 RepID=A0ABW0QW30_9BACL